VLSNIWIAKLILPDMIERGGGSYIIVSSVGSLKSHATIGAYTISKAADNQLVRNLALEWGKHNIRVNALLPGLVKTDMARVLWDSDVGRERIRTRFPSPRVGLPEDLGPAAVFMASRAGAWMTGQTVIVDGGATINP
jgi:NAD(P)-dependent dehydrogenase (short-subunit alcohol dehydrogenase family)